MTPRLTTNLSVTNTAGNTPRALSCSCKGRLLDNALFLMSAYLSGSAEATQIPVAKRCHIEIKKNDVGMCQGIPFYTVWVRTPFATPYLAKNSARLGLSHLCMACRWAMQKKGPRRPVVQAKHAAGRLFEGKGLHRVTVFAVAKPQTELAALAASSMRR